MVNGESWQVFNMIKELPIFTYFDRQRFTQFGSQDAANWYLIGAPTGKAGYAMYPAMGRRHVDFQGTRLLFNQEPRAVFKTIDYVYFVVGSRLYQYDRFFNERVFTNPEFDLSTGNVWSAYLSVNTTVYMMLTDGEHCYLFTEGTSPTFVTVTGGDTPDNPQFVAAFGNRFVVSVKDSPQFHLTQVNLGSTPAVPSSLFTVAGGPLFASASSVIRQMGVLHNQLYIFGDFATDVWSNIASQVTAGSATATFPWKLNTSYNWDFGIADPNSLDIDFGMMGWLAKNRNGLITFMMSNGQQPEPISTQAVNVVLEQASTQQGLSPYLTNEAEGFLYQYENSIFYRVSAGKFFDFGVLDLENSANCLEFGFDTKTWHRCIELNGERNRIQRHVFFNNRHLVTVSGDPAVYEMAGDIYYNELYDTDTEQFVKYPMRYELVTQQIAEKDYSEFITDYVEIDFVFGNQTFYRSDAPFNNTVYVVSEDSTPEVPVHVVSEDDKFMIQEGTNTPEFDDTHYNALLKPHVELYVSDNGGETFWSADVREFSPLGRYRWRMRWYQLGPSRNRVYKLVCVSSAPIVILGAVQNVRRASGGAN